ncbi:MAG: serine/threonine-protein kinase, partial [Bryobacterales bacterium]|nr:serine/threonine-protein kinase [Bryobacterales bacterium]
MTPERWAKITETFDAALALPLSQRGDYLAQVCAGDDDLRSQVDSLLASHEIAEATDSGRWSVGPLLALQHEQQQQEAAERIGPYEVLGKIGAGGMAEVYRVRDKRLGREVALKMLLPEFAGDKEYVERFHREARAASVLEHPNICRLYDIGVWNGRPYLTMELLEGQTLRQRMNAGPIPIDEILRIGADFADALAAAHARGFVHRDIKPGNIFLTAAGEIKILDFGLAKRMRTKAGNHPDEITLTNPHTTPGTPYYMAPEQILGENADARTDTFAAGIVLYEMSAGRPPFTGESAQAVFRQVLSADPQPPIRLRDGVPPELNRIILRALEKNRDYRYQSALDFRAELKRLTKEIEACCVDEAACDPPAPTGRRWWIAGAAIAIGSAAVTSLLLPAMRRKSAPPKILPIDSSPGFKEGPVFSPDGARVAYSFIPEGSLHSAILVRQVGLGTSVRLSRAAASDSWPVWSPDGSFLAFRRDGRDSGFYTIPSLGGGETKFADPGPRPTLMGGTNLAWAPDGSWLAYADNPGGIFAVSHPSRERRQLVADAPFLALPAISPDGKRIAYLRGTSYQSHDLYVQSVGGGAPLRVTADNRWIAGLTWTPDSRYIIYSSDRG